MKKTTFLAALGLLLPVSDALPADPATTPAAPAAEFTWQNPLPVSVNGLDGLRDPFIVKEGGTWYMTGTGKPSLPWITKSWAPPRACRCIHRPT